MALFQDVGSFRTQMELSQSWRLAPKIPWCILSFAPKAAIDLVSSTYILNQTHIYRMNLFLFWDTFPGSNIPCLLAKQGVVWIAPQHSMWAVLEAVSPRPARRWNSALTLRRRKNSEVLGFALFRLVVMERRKDEILILKCSAKWKMRPFVSMFFHALPNVVII